MAHYTITIKSLLDNDFDFGLTNYPIFNEEYRETLNNHILNYYYENEIGFETAELFKFYLNNTLDLIMPKYNQLYQAQETALLNLYGNVDLNEEGTRENTTETSSESTSNGKNQNLFQDTPQGKINLSELEDEQYATNFTLNQNDISDETSSEGSNSEETSRHIYGNNGNKYNIDLLKDIKNNLMNIDMLIINDLSDLFMGIY